MKKMLLVLAFLAIASLGASAANGHFTVQFNNYCDGMYINYTGISFGGVHILGDCVNNYNVGGFKHAAAGYTFYAGAAYDASDPLWGLGYGINSSLQYLLNVTGTVKRPGLCGWVIYDGSDGVNNYFLNAGNCTRTAQAFVKGTKSSASR